MLLRAVTSGHHRLQANPIGGVNCDDDPFAHAPNLHPAPPARTSNRTLPFEFIY